MRKKQLKAELVRLEGHAVKLANSNGIYRQRLRNHERDFPMRKRDLVEELLPYVRSIVAHPGDWAAPVIERSQAETEIRRLLGLIDETQPAGDDVVLARPEQAA